MLEKMDSVGKTANQQIVGCEIFQQIAVFEISAAI